jgi:hypothetical protein
VKIQNTLTDGQEEGTNGIIQTSSTSSAIDVQEGSKVVLAAGTVKSTGTEVGSVVRVNGTATAKSTFIMNGGIIEGLSGKNALRANTNADVQLNGGTFKTGSFYLNGANVSATVKISVPGSLNANGGANVTVSNKVDNSSDVKTLTLSTVYSKGSTVTIDATSITKLLAVSGNGILTLNSGDVTGKVTVADEGSKFTLVGGSITCNEASEAAITATAGTTVDIQGGTVAATGSGNSALSLSAATATISGAATEISAEGADAIVDAGDAKSTLTINDGSVTSKTAAALNITKGSDVVVKDGAINGVTNAVNITSGTLNVNGEGDPAFTADDITISAVPADKANVKVYLDAKKATYVSSKDLWTVYNHDNTTDGGAAAAIQSIKGGYFTGDIISDNSKYFIEGPAHFKSCNNLKENQNTYFQSQYTLGVVKGDGFYAVYFQGDPIEE